jgi:L-arabinose isomerase
VGFQILRKPLCHLHTQFNRDIPWDTIDMDFMNLNQSAHGDREFGHIGARLRIRRKVIVGHWENPELRARLPPGCAPPWPVVEARRAQGRPLWRQHARSGRHRGDKVEAQIQFGWSVNGYGVGDLVQYVNAVSDAEVDRLMEEYADRYEIVPEGRTEGPVRARHALPGPRRAGLDGLSGGRWLFGLSRPLSKICTGWRAASRACGPAADGRGLRLWRRGRLEDGGLAADDEGHGRRRRHVVHGGLHLSPRARRNEMVLGAHMLEVCESIADAEALGSRCTRSPSAARPIRLRLVFRAHAAGPAVNAALVDLGHRFRLLVERGRRAGCPAEPLPRLPGRPGRLWRPKPSLQGGAPPPGFYAGGAAPHQPSARPMTAESPAGLRRHRRHSSSSASTATRTLPELRKELRWNELYYHLARGL